MYRVNARPSALVLTTFNAAVEALDCATGERRWQYLGDPHATMRVISSDDRAFVVSSRARAASADVCCLDLVTGAVVWKVFLPAQDVADARVCASVLILSGSGDICALRVDDGVEAWRARGRVVALVPSTPAT